MQGQPDTGSSDGGCSARVLEGACESEYLGALTSLQGRLRHLQGKLLDLSAESAEPVWEGAAGDAGTGERHCEEEPEPRMIARSCSEQALLAMYRERRRKLELSLGGPLAQQRGACGHDPAA